MPTVFKMHTLCVQFVQCYSVCTMCTMLLCVYNLYNVTLCVQCVQTAPATVECETKVWRGRLLRVSFPPGIVSVQWWHKLKVITFAIMINEPSKILSYLTHCLLSKSILRYCWLVSLRPLTPFQLYSSQWKHLKASHICWTSPKIHTLYIYSVSETKKYRGVAARIVSVYALHRTLSPPLWLYSLR